MQKNAIEHSMERVQGGPTKIQTWEQSHKPGLPILREK